MTQDGLKRIKGRIEKVCIKTKGKLTRIRTRIKKLSDEIDKIEGERKTILHYEYILNRISKEVASARKDLLAHLNKLKKINQEDPRHEDLKKKVEAKTEALQKICRHQLVLSYESCRGSACENYYNRYTGARMCIVCGLRESPWNTYQGDKYKVLVNDVNERYITEHPGFRGAPNYMYDGERFRLLGDDKQIIEIDIWQQIEKLLPIFEDKEKLSDILRKY